MINRNEIPDLLTIADVNELTKYSNSITAYQMLRLRGIKPVSTRPAPGKGPRVNEYDRDTVLEVFADRIARQRTVTENA